MNQTTFKINTDIVSTTMNDKPLIFISEEAINLKRDNDNLKSIIKEVREYIEEMNVWCVEFENFGVKSKGLLEILDKVSK